MGQNLILNPSFELHLNCPSRLGNFVQDVKDWSTPTHGSSDYFHSCSKIMGVPDNFNGSQKAKHGEAYAGLYMYAPDDYREYIQANLSQALEKGRQYILSFYVSLAGKSDSSIKEFGVLLSEKSIEIPIKKELSKMHLSRVTNNTTTLLEIPSKQYLKDSDKWTLLEIQFIANGTERYITLGNFKNNAQTQKDAIAKKDSKKGAYYYLDMVSLTLENGAYSLEQTHVFKNILFHFDTYLLTNEAKMEIRDIYNHLKANPNLAISIHGHTDGLGSKAYNEKLSGERAIAVVNYMLDLGLSEERITWQGHGSAKPVMANFTENGRIHNRRVEFVLNKMDN